ncbi:MAG: hypothetical protein ACQKBT_00070, partial [Puniceicoccales bacterium]
MSFIVLLLVTLSSVIGLSTSEMNRAIAEVQARQSAQLALNIAVGQLQKHTGLDQRVTARADINTANTGNPRWIGVWDSSPSDPTDPTHADPPTSTDPVVWLINNNGTGLTPSQAAVADPQPGNTNVWLVENVLSETAANPIKLATTPVDDSAQPAARFAYWVDDNSLKAYVRLTPRFPNPTPSSEEQIQQLIAPSTFGIDLVSGFKDLFALSHTSESDADGVKFRDQLSRLEDYSQLRILDDSLDSTLTSTDLALRSEDLTTRASLGVLADTLRGGLRRDL